MKTTFGDMDHVVLCLNKKPFLLGLIWNKRFLFVPVMYFVLLGISLITSSEKTIWLAIIFGCISGCEINRLSNGLPYCNRCTSGFLLSASWQRFRVANRLITFWIVDEPVLCVLRKTTFRAFGRRNSTIKL